MTVRRLPAVREPQGPTRGRKGGAGSGTIRAMTAESTTTPASEVAPASPAALPPRSVPRIFEAERASGPSGAVVRGAELEFAAAVAHRQAAKDVVVCGDVTDANRRVALQVESAVGPPSRPQFPHKRAGRCPCLTFTN